MTSIDHEWSERIVDELQAAISTVVRAELAYAAGDLKDHEKHWNELYYARQGLNSVIDNLRETLATLDDTT